jgi:hypothetical protein
MTSTQTVSQNGSSTLPEDDHRHQLAKLVQEETVREFKL